MKDVVSILESTYLKTAKQAGIEEFENKQTVERVAQEAIDYGFKLVMVRAKYVPEIKCMIKQQNSKLLVGTVIDFPKGCSSLEDKLKIAAEAINFGADELDFVINYEAFKRGEIDVVRAEVKRCTYLCLENQKVAKWIIEIAALRKIPVPWQILQSMDNRRRTQWRSRSTSGPVRSPGSSRAGSVFNF